MVDMVTHRIRMVLISRIKVLLVQLRLGSDWGETSDFI